MRDVHIVGVSQTPVNRDAQVRTRELAATAVRDALAASQIPKSRVGALFVGNMTGGILEQQLQLGSLIADYAGLAGIDAVNIEAASASGACTSNTFMRLRMGSGMLRSSLAVVTQMTWLASMDTSANSSTKLWAVSCSSRL